MDIDPDKEGQLRFVVAPSPTLSSSTLVQVSTRAARSRDSPGAGRGVLNASHSLPQQMELFSGQNDSMFRFPFFLEQILCPLVLFQKTKNGFTPPVLHLVLLKIDTRTLHLFRK